MNKGLRQAADHLGSYVKARKARITKVALFLMLPIGALFSMISEESSVYHAEENLAVSLTDSSLVTPYPQDYFSSPLEIPLNLSGNFGELRTNHFHAGLDLKTNQQEGLNVLASAEGHISRIKVSPVGYGYCLYIDHPNGYTTVYGHLQKYNAAIDAYTEQKQYEQQSFSVDLFPNPTDLPVKKGDIIGLSGNSGGSGGPHLHFEIRETVSEKVVNPLLFGLKVEDKIPPTINGIWIIPLSDSTTVNGGTVPVNLPTKTHSGNCHLQSSTAPMVCGDVGFAIHTSDMLDGNQNRCGIYRIELFVDGLQVYGQRMDKLDFTTNRAMNAHTIYEKFKKDRSQIHGSYRLPGNPLDIYDNLVNDGIVSFKDGKTHELLYRIVDIMGNTSTVTFKVAAQTSSKAKPKVKNALAHFNWEEDNAYDNGKVKIQIPAFTLYEDLALTITEQAKGKNAASPTYLIGSPYEPVHNKWTLAIKADHIPEKYRGKTMINRWDPDKQTNTYEGSKYDNGFIYGEPSYLGYFSLMIDTVAPIITPTSFSSSMKGKYSFSFSISDWMSGISQIIPKIDGQWALMEFDAKTKRLTYYYDPNRVGRGKHSFELTVIDNVGNSKTYTSDFTW